MRVSGGAHGGRTLKGPASQNIRPTSDKLRQAAFNILAHAYGDAASGARVLDLFAGTGALGIEAISRGAVFTLFVEEAAEARALIRANVETLQLTGITKIYRRDATKLGPRGAFEPFSLVFCDTPYGKGLAEKALVSALDGAWLTKDALLVVEEAVSSKFSAPEGYKLLERREYDDTEVVFLRLASAE
jgi:16S rRNA (guanine966-N2)-methyltransferase